MKRTKIIATIGPASTDIETLVAMIRAGMNAARLNFSHGTYASHAKLINNIRAAEQQTGARIGIMQDLSGPKLRLGEFHERELKSGEHVVLGHGGIPVMRHIWKWIKPGQDILIDDGLMELVAVKVNQDNVEAKVLVGGQVVSHKGINLPGVKVDLPILSEKDLEDLEFGLKNGIDFVAQSFVKTAADIHHLRKYIHKYIPIVAKIETPEALKSIDAIIAAADAVMVARGDMALNVPQELVPIAQKNIIKKCLKAGKPGTSLSVPGKPVIVATQMLDSMIHNPRPTRAEISDVANAVIDHADCVMLSGETAFGKYPVKTVGTMARIIDQIEESPLDDFYHQEKSYKNLKDRSLVLAHNLLHIARNAHSRVIVVSDLAQAANLARFRSEKELIVLASKDTSVLRRSSLLWGVVGVMWKGEIKSTLKHQGLIKSNERFFDATGPRVSAVIQSMH